MNRDRSSTPSLAWRRALHEAGTQRCIGLAYHDMGTTGDACSPKPGDHAAILDTMRKPGPGRMPLKAVAF
ncbi:hypothetical protein ABTK40_20740, partial [Acinetobacter baumannii]